MSYNPYGGMYGRDSFQSSSNANRSGNPYGAPPGYGGYGNPPPGMGAPGGLGPPPGMQAPPGMHQAQAPQSNGMPHSFQPPANLPNINFNAPVIRLGTTAPAQGGRDDGPRGPPSGRSGLGMDRGGDSNKQSNREQAPILIPPTAEEKLRTIFVHGIPDGVGDRGIQKLLSAVGFLKRWETLGSVKEERKGRKFGFALFDDVESLDNAVRLLSEEEVLVPTKRQVVRADPPDDDTFEDIEKEKLEVTVDPASQSYLESYREDQGEAVAGAVEAARGQLKQVIRNLFYPAPGTEDADGDAAMGNTDGDNVEVVNIPLAADDELADIPAELRETVTAEIAAFRERSIQRDLERLRKEEEIEEMERQRNGGARRHKVDSPAQGINNVPVGPRGGVANAPSGPRGQNGTGRGVGFVNGGVENGGFREEDDTDASDEELNRRTLSSQKAEAERLYNEAERKWSNRERSRQAALEREKDREKNSEEVQDRRVQDQLSKDKGWDDEKEASRKSHMYYRDHPSWTRKRNIERVDEEARDEGDRRAEQDEARREKAQMERARGMADSFLDQQAEEIDRREAAAAAAVPEQPFKLSLGAAAQKAQASRAGPQRRTIAEVEGLLDNEETDTGTRRQLIPIEYDASTAAAGMTEEEISEAVRKLAQEIPADKEGLWAWQVKWDYMDESVVRNKLRPFVEKKIVEYLGVQEEMLVEAVEDHLRKHGGAGELVEELEGALDDEAEDLVKKLWRMVIFFTECEKRGLPA